MKTTSLVMANYGDYNGVFMTVQHVRMSSEVWWDEIIVVDSSWSEFPQEHAELLQLQKEIPRLRVVPYSGVMGTTQTRNHAMDVTTSDVVFCVDSHVLLDRHARSCVLNYFDEPANRGDIVSGPMLGNSLRPKATHFFPKWQNRMWGVWGNAWVSKEGTLFTPVEGADGRTMCYTLTGGLKQRFLQSGVDCLWADRVQRLLGLEAVPWTEINEPDATIEIPGMGLGCFAVWRDNWPGFNRHARGFGGEELSIHELYRQRGGKAVCLNGFRWLHRFYRGVGAPQYKLDGSETIRNHVLWHSQLGLSLSTMHGYFVLGEGFPQTEWDRIVADPVGFVSAADIRLA